MSSVLVMVADGAISIHIKDLVTINRTFVVFNI